MTKPINTYDGYLGTLNTTLFTASSKSITKLVQVINDDGGAPVDASLYIVDTSDNVKKILLPMQSIESNDGRTDTSMHVIRNGEKIVGSASVEGTIIVEITVIEGVS